ncbi:hypothetical protein FRC08_016553 [Ceratobasidium sp. 394]|nr:hypothetical protein FRC08_016553 [Ceratobasidium sp. 394]
MCDLLACFSPPQTIPAMAPWQFNLRSGFDSDEEGPDSKPLVHASSESTGAGPRDHDANENQTTRHSLPDATSEDSISKELRELFGTPEEEKVCYKPNPWSIAKMNANARATTDHSSFRKPTFKSPWPTKPTKPVRQRARREAISSALT